MKYRKTIIKEKMNQNQRQERFFLVKFFKSEF